MIKLSIIVPVYNVEKYVRPCIESIFNQGLNDDEYEVIIINDGSTDRSMDMIKDIIDQHHNISIINQENQGLSVARNNGIAAAKGEYILMPDSDDLLIEGSLVPLLKIAFEFKPDIIVADFLKMTDNDINIYIKDHHIQNDWLVSEMTGEELYLNELVPNEYYVWRTLYRRNFILENNLNFIPGIFFQDIPFTHKSYLKAKKCIRTNGLLNIYRRGHQSVSAPSSFKMKNAQDFCIAIANSWNLRKAQGHSPIILKKHMDYIYISFLNLLYRTLFAINGTKKKVEIIKTLRNYAPDLHFSNGIKQTLTSLLYI